MSTQSAHTSSTLKTILVTVPPTGARPLRPLLDDLAQQARATESNDARTVSVMLLDNSAAGSEPARAAAAACEVEYRRVETPGFSRVRNAAMEEAQRYDALVFIDDDERLAPGPCRGQQRRRRRGPRRCPPTPGRASMARRRSADSPGTDSTRRAIGGVGMCPQYPPAA